MSSGAYPNPVQAVARAARFRAARNTLVAAGAVLMTAFGMTAAVIWPTGQHGAGACPAGSHLVLVRPFVRALDPAGQPAAASSLADRSDRSDRTWLEPVPLVSGCVDHADLVPIAPPAPTVQGEPMSARG